MSTLFIPFIVFLFIATERYEKIPGCQIDKLKRSALEEGVFMAKYILTNHYSGIMIMWTEAAIKIVLCKKVFLEISQNSQEVAGLRP